MTYRAPQTDILFALIRVLAVPALPNAPDAELIGSIVGEAAKLAEEVFAPLNRVGDTTGLRFVAGVVTTPPGFRAAYEQYVAGGWNGLPFAEAHGGQALPHAVAMAVQEMLQGANLSLALCTLLNQGAVEVLSVLGSTAQQARYLPKLMSGAWTGTMNLTEPQAGSDVGAVACKAWPDGQHYRVQGQKIFISYGEHDLAENILHLVLARLPNAPPGTKGLSLFLVPKLLVGEDGAPGAANDLACLSLEHKLGQHASPACTMAYGEQGGAYAELIGKEGGGIEAMFVMMNAARLGVGIQGLGIAERAYQAAAEFARSRVQSRPLQGGSASVPIIQHPDVRRMLMRMKTETEGARLLAFSAGLAQDQGAQARVDLLTPVVKAWLTELANTVTSTAVQVFGGMGFVEETGVAQHMRDARVLAIYEGTNGIQANDLVFRKLLRDEGRAFFAYLTELQGIAAALAAQPGDDALVTAKALHAALTHLEEAGRYLLRLGKAEMDAAAFAATPFLHLFGITASGAMLALAATHALAGLQTRDAAFTPQFLETKLVTARFYAENVLPQTAGLLTASLNDGRSTLTLPVNAF